MNLAIHEVDVVGDRGRLVDILMPHLEDHRNAAHYEWLYLRNPAGRARAWVAEDGASGRVVGAAAALPKRVSVQGRSATCWNLSDFVIAPECRSLGPAVKLQRACLAPVLAGEIPFAYDHPSPAMLAVYARLGVRPTGQVVRHARVLRAEAYVRRRVTIGPLARSLGWIADTALTLWRPLRGTAGVAVRVLDRPFDEHVAAARHSLADESAIVVERTAEYLEWRYRACPARDYETFVASRDDRPLGFLVVRRERHRHASIVDLVAPPEAGSALLARAALEMRARGADTLSVSLLEGAREPFPTGKCGFVPRDTAPFVVTVARNGDFAGVVDRAANWFLSNGDRDV